PLRLSWHLRALIRGVPLRSASVNESKCGTSLAPSRSRSEHRERRADNVRGVRQMSTHDGSNRPRILQPGSRLRPWIWAGGVIALIIGLAYAARLFINEPLRRYTEAKMNRAMKGYTVHIAGLQFHPINFALNLKGLTVSQNGHPNQPILEIPYLHASVHWK